MKNTLQMTPLPASPEGEVSRRHPHPDGLSPSGEMGKAQRGVRVARGLRNNNPLNIRHSSDHWQGMRSEQTDKAFVQFISLSYGFRAAFKTIRTYMTKHGCKNITQIIMRWAPPSENHTGAYVAKVSEMSGIHPLEPIDFSNGAMMKKIVQAMAYVENGVIVDGDSIEKGYQLAINN